ncbi:hypothetical protein C4E15_25070 [Achromobacter spanius]|uniref:Lipoprotein n=1 Tax=Achromobacter spanius TaxID=217203 RepID=A0A2S5GL42_9BURK|nr:hypothetical protein [Achromobacter spanius]PPA73601.1 hypothetical protein C4E15_25070 [Achromobacter spanius]
MQILRSAVRCVIAPLCFAAMAACTSQPARQTDMDYHSRPSSTTQSATGNPGSSGQRLTIQSGEGERLNLPWFIRDTQDWVNSN